MLPTKEYEIALAIFFIDFEKAFDSIHPKVILETLKNKGNKKTYVNTPSNMYREATPKVEKYDDTPKLSTYRGVRLGVNVSHELFNVTLQNTFHKLKGNNNGIVI